jgi:uncharacterized protein (DUF433 family)
MTTERIEINPAIMMGKPVIRGTRITVELILRRLAEGASEAELLQDYPHLTTEDIRALWPTARPAWPTRKWYYCPTRRSLASPEA